MLSSGKIFLGIATLGFVLFSCQDRKQQHIQSLLSVWQGKEILFPQDMEFVVDGRDTVDVIGSVNSGYKIVNYVDSTGCLSCKLQLPLWNLFITQMDSVCHSEVPVYMVFAPRTVDVREMQYILRRDTFHHPVCLDLADSFNRLNGFPSDMAFRTFLLDKDNKVLAIGNPVLNPKVKDLYLRIIRGESPQAPSDVGTPVTTVSVSSAEADLGTFPWQEPRTCTFTLRNTGDRPLVIHDVTTSCGCLTVDYPDEPARPGEELTLRAHYRADSRGTVLKSMQVYCNAQGAPLRLRVTGTAE